MIDLRNRGLLEIIPEHCHGGKSLTLTETGRTYAHRCWNRWTESKRRQWKPSARKIRNIAQAVALYGDLLER
jgi:DNA-binding PadR family transcriptional regulator